MPTIKSDNIYLGDTSVKKMYLNGALIFQNFTFIKVTAITLDSLTWTTNIPASGGTATKDNCTYSVTAYYSDGTTSDVTSEATITGSQEIPSTSIEEVHSAGTLTLTASYSGFTATGNVTVYQEAAISDFSKEPLTFNILSAGAINWTASSTALTKRIEYKLNNNEWASITSNTSSSAPKINVVKGDKIQFRGNNTAYGESTSSYSTFGSSTAEFEVEGNIMSLIYGDDFKNNSTISSDYVFISLFGNCTKLVSAKNLILPATTLAYGCYRTMFNGCSNLRTAPKLPATTLAGSCYSNMFNGCTSLTVAPELPVTTLATYCYQGMFGGCTSLTVAPELPATILTEACYSFMFDGCSSLNYIKCLATNIYASDCTRYWVSGVTSTGTFVKNPNISGWPTGKNGIPEGWTIIDA